MEKYLTLYSDNNYDILFNLEPDDIVPMHNIYIVMNNKTNSDADLLIKSFTFNDETTPLESENILIGLGTSYVKENTKGFYMTNRPRIYSNKESTYSFEFFIENSNDEYDVSNITKKVKILPIDDIEDEDKISITNKNEENVQNEIEDLRQDNTINNLTNQSNTFQTTEDINSKDDTIVNDEKLPQTGAVYSIIIILLIIIISCVIYKKYKENKY